MAAIKVPRPIINLPNIPTIARLQPLLHDEYKSEVGRLFNLPGGYFLAIFSVGFCVYDRDFRLYHYETFRLSLIDYIPAHSSSGDLYLISLNSIVKIIDPFTGEYIQYTYSSSVGKPRQGAVFGNTVYFTSELGLFRLNPETGSVCNSISQQDCWGIASDNISTIVFSAFHSHSAISGDKYGIYTLSNETIRELCTKKSILAPIHYEDDNFLIYSVKQKLFVYNVMRSTIESASYSTPLLRQCYRHKRAYYPMSIFKSSLLLVKVVENFSITDTVTITPNAAVPTLAPVATVKEAVAQIDLVPDDVLSMDMPAVFAPDISEVSAPDISAIYSQN